jgi:hypothetical protein
MVGIRAVGHGVLSGKGDAEVEIAGEFRAGAETDAELDTFRIVTPQEFRL